jgi:SAM-dependent methyltransferase
VLVPGCGKGYDVALFAAHGYDAYGLEVSTHAAEAARKYLEEPGKGPLEGEYLAQDKGVGKMEVLVGDYFEDGWLVDGGEFDIIYDNTVRPPRQVWMWLKGVKLTIRIVPMRLAAVSKA